MGYNAEAVSGGGGCGMDVYIHRIILGGRAAGPDFEVRWGGPAGQSGLCDGLWPRLVDDYEPVEKEAAVHCTEGDKITAASLIHETSRGSLESVCNRHWPECYERIECTRALLSTRVAGQHVWRCTGGKTGCDCGRGARSKLTAFECTVTFWYRS